MKGEVAPDPESLVAHRGFVEALARRLVDDRHVAEDLAQETFLAALRNPPKAAALRGFLARVLRRRRARWLRDEERRLRRERAAATPDRAEGGGDLVARLSWHRKVVDTLLALEEPFRTTLLLRFYEDLKPKEIAERLGVPAGTVRARLSRGLEQMRARLDADHRGDRRSWQLGLLPLLSFARPSGALLGVAAMTGSKKLVATVALVLALAGTGYVTLRTLQREAPPARSDAPRGAVTVAEIDRAPDPKSTPTEEGSTLVVRVRNERDEPIAGAEVVVLETMPDVFGASSERRWAAITRDEVKVAARTVTQDSGEVTFGGLRGNRWDIVARAKGFGRASMTVRGARRTPVTLRLGPARTLCGRVTDALGAPIPGAIVLAGEPALAWWTLDLARPFRAVTNEQGEYAFDALPARDTSVFASMPGGLAYYVATLRFPGPGRFDITLRRGATLSGTVTDSSGHAIPGAEVSATASGGQGYTLSDTAGRYVIDTLPPGTLHALRAQAPGYVMDRGITDVVPLREGETVTADVRMLHGARIRGVALGPGGPLDGASVCSLQRIPSGGVLQRWATADDQGRFELDDIGPGWVLLSVGSAGHRQDGFPKDPWEAARTADEETPWLLRVEEGEQVDYVANLSRGDLVMEGTVLDSEDHPVEGARVFAWGTEAESAADGSFRIEHVLAGEGLVWAHAPGFRQVEPKPAVASRVVVRLEREPDARLLGTVRGPAGEVPDGAFVLLAVPGPSYGRGTNQTATEEERRWYTATRHPVQAGGSFEIPLQGIAGVHDRLWLRAGAPGMADCDPVEIAVDKERERYEAALVLARGCALDGVVTGPGGERLAGVLLAARRLRPQDRIPTDNARGPAEAVAAVSDRTGAFRVEDLGVGWWEIVATARGFVENTKRAELPAGAPVRISLERTLAIVGHVVSADGSPVSDAFVQVDGAPGSGSRGRVTYTDATGRFVAEDLLPGEYSVRVAGTLTVNIIEATKAGVAAGTRDLRIVVERGLTISGTVVSAKGAALPLLEVTATPETPEIRGAERWVQTGAQGTFTITGLRDVIYTLAFCTAENRTHVVRRSARAGTEGLRVEFSPERPAHLTLEGTLVDESGTPLADRWVRTTSRKRGHTDETGRFVIAELEPGRYRLVLERSIDRTNYLAALGEAEAGATGLRLVARSGEEIRGVVSSDLGPVADIYVTANLERGVQRGQDPILAKTDASGAFRLTGVPPGETCTISASGNAFVPIALKDVAAGTVDLRIVLERGLEVRGRLVDADGAPLAGASVRFRSERDTYAWATTKADGTFHAKGLAPGRNEAEAKLAEGSYRPCGTVDAGATGVELRRPAK
jgi:RNA polymerase sigma factor (sigma-70 family)